MIDRTELLKMVFLDIETISAYENFEEAPEPLKSSFMKSYRHHDDPDYDDLWKRFAPLKSECNQIISVAFGTLKLEGGIYRKNTLKHVSMDNPRTMASVLQKLGSTISSQGGMFAGHNILNFDLPTIARKLIIAGLPIPTSLLMYGVKPWEVNHKDSMLIWGQGAYGYKASLESLCHVLGVETPKVILSGDKVSEHYYGTANKKDALADIGEYCMKDVAATMEVMCRLYGVTPEQIDIY